MKLRRQIREQEDSIRELQSKIETASGDENKDGSGAEEEAEPEGRAGDETVCVLESQLDGRRRSLKERRGEIDRLRMDG